MSSILDLAKETLDIEAKAIQNLVHQLDESFQRTVETILAAEGKVIVTGMGKSGTIGMKVAATMASTGTPSFFLHPAEAFHGDLGMVESRDVILAISYSGETDELLKLIPFFRENRNRVIAMTGKATSTLAVNADYHISVRVDKEACPLDLAPTSSTTASLVMGDALAVALMKTRNFQAENFARFHPGGTLGRRLLTCVKDVMHTNNLPWVQQDTPIREILRVISASRLGVALVATDGQLPGIITDGDIRRAMEREDDSFFRLVGADLMTSGPIVISPESRLPDAVDLMNEHKIGVLPVAKNNEVLGIVQLFDLKI
ncbi:MAG: KpsF/GutQ family sugar-phosphate isomerase [Bacteroidota bacterium]